MDELERLLRDHKVLRAKLDVIEASLNLPSETWFVLRELCFTLSRQLQDHIRREEELVIRCRNALNPSVLAEVAIEHHDEPELLRTINRLFTDGPRQSLNHIKPMLKDALFRLRHHMGEEERYLFPLFDKYLKTAGVKQPTSRAARLHETMTVNRVIHEFPKTRPTLEGLFVNIPIEGCHCLDEVAWRHGIEPEELVKTLEAVIASCAYQKAPEQEAANHS